MMRQKIDNLTSNNKWLFWHRQIATSQALGLDNGHLIDKNDLELMKFKYGKSCYRLKPEATQKIFDRLLENLENYQTKWNTETFVNNYTDDVDAYIYSDKNFTKIVRLFELLQV